MYKRTLPDQLRDDCPAVWQALMVLAGRTRYRKLIHALLGWLDGQPAQEKMER